MAHTDSYLASLSLARFSHLDIHISYTSKISCEIARRIYIGDARRVRLTFTRSHMHSENTVFYKNFRAVKLMKFYTADQKIVRQI
jgi:hypothetical protein